MVYRKNSKEGLISVDDLPLKFGHKKRNSTGSVATSRTADNKVTIFCPYPNSYPIAEGVVILRGKAIGSVSTYMCKSQNCTI